MSGSSAHRDQKGLRSHFSKLLPFLLCLHRSWPHSWLLAPTEGKAHGPTVAPCPPPGNLTFENGARHWPLTQALLGTPTKAGQPQVPELGVPSQPHAQVAGLARSLPALTVGRGGYCGLRRGGAAGARGPDGVAAVTV